MSLDEILAQFKGKRVLVTGGSGLIGRQIIGLLSNTGAEITNASLDNVVIFGAKSVKADLTEMTNCLEITKDKDYVFHIAGIKGSVEVTKSHPASFFVNLLMMNTNMLEACRRNNVEKVVYTSSIGAYGSSEVFREDQNTEAPPMDAFPGWAKRMAEKQIEAYTIQYGLRNFAIVRPGNVYGPGDNFDPKNAMVIPSLMYRIASGENPVTIWGDGSAIRDFAYSRDVAEGIIRALYFGTRSSFINLGSGIGITIKELVETIQKVVNFNYKFDTTKSSGFPKRVMDITRAKEWVGYNPLTTLEDGLRETWRWFLDHQSEHHYKKNYFRE